LWKTENLGQEFGLRLQQVLRHYGVEMPTVGIRRMNHEETADAMFRYGQHEYHKRQAATPVKTEMDIIPIEGKSSRMIDKLIGLDNQAVRARARTRKLTGDLRRLETEAGTLPENLTPMPEPLDRQHRRSSEFRPETLQIQPHERHPTDPLFRGR
jgi:hypothetical protein